MGFVDNGSNAEGFGEEEAEEEEDTQVLNPKP